MHPTKAEVRFRDGQHLYRQLLSTLRNRFLGIDLESTLSIPERPRLTGLKPAVDPQRQLEIQQELATWAKQQLADWQPGPPTLTTENADGDDRPAAATLDDAGWTSSSPADRAFSPADEVRPDDFPVADAGAFGHRDAPRRDAAEPFPGNPHLPPSRVMQIHDCYLVVETDEGLTVIDQHALHERVLYEQLRERVLAGPVESQRMLVPETIELPPAEAALVLEHRDVLEQLGIGVGEFGGGTLLLTGYPAMLEKADPVELVRHVAEQLNGAGQKPSRRDILDRLLHMMSCRAAVKAGQRLTSEEMDALVAKRHLVDDAHHCPHGRPTALVLSRAELDRQFGRI